MSLHEKAMKDINLIAEKLTITQSLELSKKISSIRNYINDTEWLEKKLEELKKEISDRQEVENSLTEWVDEMTDELNKLKRDVARYFELQYKNQFDHMTQNEIHEMYVLRDKLLTVGKEE